jgi:hypothetical protein
LKFPKFDDLANAWRKCDPRAFAAALSCFCYTSNSRKRTLIPLVAGLSG